MVYKSLLPNLILSWISKMWPFKKPLVNLKTTRPIDRLIIHCAATPPEMDIGVEEIRKWHLERGFDDIGYHHVNRRDGTLEAGRPLDEIGAHVKGYNTGSIGVCLVGGVDVKNKPDANFTITQWDTLREYVKEFKKQYPKATIHGHNEFDNKACPSFNVQEWLKKEGLL